MNPDIEFHVYTLIIHASIFTKLILLFLLTISVVSWAIMLHKYLFINNYKSDLAHFLKTLTNQANIAYLEDSCVHFSQGSAKRIPILLLSFIRSRKQGKLIFNPDSILNTAAMQEANRLKKGMGILATSANISPLIGLLGTVWGVMYAFINIRLEGSANITAVAPGIAEALITTIAGFCVAIPAMAGHSFLAVWINLCMDYLDRISEYAVYIFGKE